MWYNGHRAVDRGISLSLGDCAFTIFGRSTMLNRVSDGPTLFSLLHRTIKPIDNPQMTELEQHVQQYPESVLYRRIWDMCRPIKEISRFQFVVRRDKPSDNATHPESSSTPTDGYVYSVKDLGSLNGTFLDNQRIPPETWVPLCHGSVVRIVAQKPEYHHMCRVLTDMKILRRVTQTSPVQLQRQKQKRRRRMVHPGLSFPMNNLHCEFIFDRDNRGNNDVAISDAEALRQRLLSMVANVPVANDSTASSSTVPTLSTGIPEMQAALGYLEKAALGYLEKVKNRSTWLFTTSSSTP